MNAVETKQSSQQEEIAGEVIRKRDQLAGQRSAWEGHWQEIAELVFPTDSRSFSSLPNIINQGEKRGQKMFDSTANTALNRFVAIMDSLLTPHNQMWHKITTDDPVLNRNHKVKEYFDTVTKILFAERYSQTSNFIGQNQLVWLALGAYGTGGLFTDQLWGNPGIRYKHIHLSELYFSENHQGFPDTVYRSYRLTARQAMQKWGTANAAIIQNMAKDNPETLYDFIHCTMPKENYDPMRRDFRGMPFASYDVSVVGNRLLVEGGYRTFPYAVSRYTQSLQEVYGRSPAMDVLPTIKTLNEEKKSLLVQAHRATNPIYLVHDDGVLNTMSARPGTVLAGGMSPDGRKLVDTLQVGNTQIGQDIMTDDRNDIKDAFLVSLFQILVESPQMTATEVMERTREKGMLIAPTIGRQEAYLANVINREIDVLAQQGRLPPMPNLLRAAGGQYKIRYESPLAKMRRAEEASGLMRMMQTSLEIAQATQDPTVMFYYNFDNIMPDLADINGLPAKWVNTLETVQAMKQGLQEQQATEQLIQAGPSAAAVIKATGSGQGGI